jgi:Type I phosphodiesterase / nucleotide pyrophosphatase
MGCANHIGRVGALAVTLGVGWAVASAPGIAYADTSGSSDASQSSTPGKARTSANDAGSDTASDDASGGEDSGSGDDSGDDQDADDQDADDDNGDAASVAEDEPATKPAKSRGANSALASSSQSDPDETQDPAEANDVPDDDVTAPTPAAGTGEASPPQTTAATSSATSTGATTPARTAAAQPTLVSLITDVVTALVQPRPEPAPVSPLQGSTMLASLAAARDELERNALRRSTVTAPQAASAPGADTPNVLVIGVDGTNLSRVLATLGNDSNFFKLMQGSTTAASSIVGHTTVSNPSWSSILTGAWGEKTGVINNVFTPWTYDKWPTMFTQLETLDPDIQTTSIANWNVISAIAASGEGVDTVINIPELPDDPRWLVADDLVGDFTEAEISKADADLANLMFSYFVGIDENGHLYGGDSPEYAEAIVNFDRNLGEIIAAVDAWEAINGEQWTIMMVTDHGHQPQKGLGHGFQSPDETATFVIANNPDLFTPGGVNLKYSIVDVTPTVLTLFGFEPADDADGVSLTELDDSTVLPGNDTTALRQALNDAIAMNGYPDIATNIALSVRTIAATIPYYVDNITNGIVGALQGLAGQDIFLISPLAALAVIPVDIIGDVAYIATNIVAQIVARLTGVTGASIFPLERPPTPTFPDAPEEASTPDLLAVVCTDGRVSGAVFACGTTGIGV